MLSLVLFMIINMGQLCSCGEPVNPYLLAHWEGQFLADDIVYINCNFCGAGNPVEIITTNEDGQPTTVRIPLPGEWEEDSKTIQKKADYTEQTIEIILPRKVAKVKAPPLPVPKGLTIGE